MDGDPDIAMDEGDVVKSTEVDHSEQTVNPSTINLATAILSPVKEPMPILTHDRHGFAPTSSRSSDQDGSASVSMDEGSSDFSEVESHPTELKSPLHSKQIVEVVIPSLKKFEPLPYSSGQSGLVYDVRMRFHTEPASPLEDEIHPEDPRRIWAIYQTLVDAGLVQDSQNPNLDPSFQLYRIDARDADPSEICLVHTKAHFEWVRSLRSKSIKMLLPQMLISHKLNLKMNCNSWPWMAIPSTCTNLLLIALYLLLEVPSKLAEQLLQDMFETQLPSFDHQDIMQKMIGQAGSASLTMYALLHARVKRTSRISVEKF
jgi:hypothetical protein